MVENPVGKGENAGYGWPFSQTIVVWESKWFWQTCVQNTGKRNFRTEIMLKMDNKWIKKPEGVDC